MYIDYSSLFVNEEAFQSYCLGMSFFVVFIGEFCFTWFSMKLVFESILPYLWSKISTKIKSRISSSTED